MYDMLRKYGCRIGRCAAYVAIPIGLALAVLSNCGPKDQHKIEGRDPIFTPVPRESTYSLEERLDGAKDYGITVPDTTSKYEKK